MALIISTLIIVLLIISIVGYLTIVYEWYRKVKITTISAAISKKGGSEINVNKYKQAPGPMPWPILGNLALLGQYDVPFEGFTQLAKKFGDVYSLTLGTTRCLIVNNLDLIREVLNQNGKFFGGRPDFVRFHKLFGGDRNNSLALCDWSHLQQKRRNLARKHCSPRDASSFYTKMSDVGCFEMQEFMDKLNAEIVPGKDYYLKPIVMQTCANMFSQYMCSIRFDYNDKDFQGIVGCFDKIFWEINQGYAVDFLPWLLPFYWSHMKKLVHWSTEIRKFILERIINKREQHIDLDEPENDFTDALLKSLAEDPTVSRDTIIYMLEDFLGGHSAIGNLVMLTLAYIVRYPEIGKAIQNEVDQVTENGKRKVNLHDTENMPYTIATIYEVLRHSSSPIVPHVATEDACIAGYGVTKGTIVFINNYELNTSEKYWDEPEKFNPERFLEKITIEQPIKTERKISESSSSSLDSGIENENKFDYNIIINNGNDNEDDSAPEYETTTKTIIPTTTTTNIITTSTNKFIVNNRVKKNIPHFLPFSIGKRTCIGQNLVRSFSFIMLANIMQSFDVSCSDIELIKTYPACVALPPETFPLQLEPRQKPYQL